MGWSEFGIVLFLAVSASAQSYKVCVTHQDRCQSLELGNSQALCTLVGTRVECASEIAQGRAELGYVTDEELLMLGQTQSSDYRVVATVRDVAKMGLYSFEAVALVPSSHTGGLEGLKGGSYCHPGLGYAESRWSPRVLRTLEQAAAGTDRCADSNVQGKTAEEIEVHILSKFFSHGCRPGRWSYNATVDANLKTQYPSLCSLCGGTSPSCSGYNLDMGVAVSGVNNENRHIQTLECLRVNRNTTTVAYVAWSHVQEFFMIRNPSESTSFSVLCPDNTLVPLTTTVLNNTVSPCAFVRQPWGALIASAASATNILTSIRQWWPLGSDPGANQWQSTAFGILAGGANARVVFEDTPQTVANYTYAIRPIPSIDATATCLPPRRWCTISAQEQNKCSWLRSAAYTLGIQPTISCQLRSSVFECLKDIKDDRADLISAPSNYGYLARQHYGLNPVKLVQNTRNAAARVAAFVKETPAHNITRFENLRGTKACFPEFSGLAYMAFIRAAQQLSVISTSECDYAGMVGEFFEGACAPGAIDATHAISGSSYNATNLCTVCRPATTNVTIAGNSPNFTCAYDNTNLYYGNTGALRCLNDPNTHVAILNIQNMEANLASLGLAATQFRALCSNNTLAATTGINIDDNCVLANVVDAEVLARRNDPLFAAKNVLLDTLGEFFGYATAPETQLIDFKIFSPFNNTSDLLFKDSTIGLTEPSIASIHEPASNYIKLFDHLVGCTSAAAPPIVGIATRFSYSLFTMAIMAVVTRFVVY